MKTVIAAILLSLVFYHISHSQDCKNIFANTVSQNYLNKHKHFEKIVARSLKNQKFSFSEAHRIINIPIIVFDGKPVINLPDSLRSIFFCLLCNHRIEFDMALIFIDDLFYGMSTHCPSKNGKVKFIKGSEPYSVSLTSLAKKLNGIKPDVVFRIYNLPNVYWYIKNNELFALSYERSKGGYGSMTNFQIIKPEDYIDSVDEDILLLMLSLKKVRIDF